MLIKGIRDMLPLNDTRSGFISVAVLVPALLLALCGPVAPAVASEPPKTDAVTKLRDMKGGDRQGLGALADTIRKDSLGVVSDIVTVWKTGDADLAFKSAYILGWLGDVAIEPLLEVGSPADPARQAWRLKRLMEAQLERRDAIVSELTKQLDNQTHLPVEPSKSAAEDPPVEPRLCDLAYLHLRRLLNTRETSQDHLETAYIFQRLEPETRDMIIRRFKTQGSWVNILEWEFIEPDDAAKKYPPRPME
jgi:hypothetical protein